MLEDLQKQITEAGRQLGVDKKQLDNLFKNDSEHSFKIELGDGSKYQAYRVQHSSKNGPYKGGVRFHGNLNFDEVSALAVLMSLKTAALGLPLGGGKGGVAVDPRSLSKPQLEELSRKYVSQLLPHIGPDKDIPAPDVNTNAEVIDWMVDEYEKLTKDTSKASFTGKSIAKGGIAGRNAATGRGGVIVLSEFLKLAEEPAKNLSFAVLGFGNVGKYFALEAKSLQPQWRFVAAADSTSGIYSNKTLDPQSLASFKQKREHFSSFKEAAVKVVKSEKFVELDVDVLVLAALEDSINTNNMRSVKARYIVEMANGPVSSAAYDYLTGQGVMILPDIIANAGGVIVSYLEWSQNKKVTKLTQREVNEQLKKYLTKATEQMYQVSEAQKVSLKEAALMNALKSLLL